MMFMPGVGIRLKMVQTEAVRALRPTSGRWARTLGRAATRATNGRHLVHETLSVSRLATRVAITWCAVPCFSKVISVVNYRFSTPIEYGEKTAFRTFDALSTNEHC
jgi:hypothetical protein